MESVRWVFDASDGNVPFCNNVQIVRCVAQRFGKGMKVGEGAKEKPGSSHAWWKEQYAPNKASCDQG